VNDDEFAELFKRLTSGRSSDASWRDIAVEFESLGKTLGEVLRRAWENQDAESGWSQLSDLVASAIQRLNAAVDGTSEAAQAREQLRQVIESLQAATHRATAELRPELLNMLRRANAELRRHVEDEPA
jgi:hypothetical protein